MEADEEVEYDNNDMMPTGEISENDERYKEIVEKILEDPKNISTPKELHQQAKACLRALAASDANRDGVVSSQEIGKLSELMGLPMSSEDLEGSPIDIDKDGTVTHHEYLEWWLQRISRQPGLASQQRVMAKNTFLKFDADESGAIDAREFSDLVSSLGVQFSDKECEEAILELDSDGSGRIELDEFVNWWVNRTQSIRKGGGLIAYKLKRIANKAAKMFYTDIHKAVWEGDLNLVKLFLEAGGAHLNSPDTSEYGNGWTPLHYACYKGHEDIVSILLDRGAKVNISNYDGFSPLFYAAQQEHSSICAMLLDAGADPSMCGIVSDPKKIHSEAEAMEDMYYGIPPLCPADFVSSDIVHSSEDLREVFSVHEKFAPPEQPDVVNVKLSKSGVFSFDIVDIKEFSHLPIRKWNISFYMNDDLCTDYSFAHNISERTVSHTPDQEHLLKIITALQDGNIISVELIGMNACGKSEPSYKIDVDMSEI